MRQSRRVSRIAAIAAAVLALALPSKAYYHYLHFNGRNFASPLYEKFDLSTLSNKTVTFFVRDQSDITYSGTDSLGSVLNQVKQAALAWNAAPYSDLRVAFGGLKTPGQPLANTPGGEVTFIDLPPGVLGMGGPVVSLTPSLNGFYPILRATVMLSRDTSLGAGPSYLENFFTTAVHEIGHGLGLQHTWTGSAMSQGVIRNTSRIRPLDADDIAGLSVLYGKPGWSSNYGSITGRVTYTNGNPVALGSVVAIPANGPAVSALTNPDGTYRIDGLPPGATYSVYAHPLPPDAVGSEGLRYPVDQNGTQFTPSGPFQTVFLRTGGTTLDPQQALTVAPAAGAVVPNVNLAVTPRVNTTTYNVVTFSRLDSPTRSYVWNGGDTYITPAFISSSQAAALVVAQAASPAFLPNPLSVTVLGGFAPATLNSDKWPSVVPLAGFPGEVQLYLVVPIGTGIGQRHIVFNFGNDLYVLPGGLNLVPKGPPLITGVAANPDGTVTVSGAGLAADTAIYFDGIKAAAVGSFNGNDSQGSITVVPAAGAAPHVATVVAYNPDGQNSTILQSQNPPTYAYPVAASPQITAMNLNSLPAGATAAINITTANTNFVDGQVSVGFGSDDILVRRVWVQDATHLTANVAVASNAVLAASEISIMSGLQTITQPGGFQTLPARPGIPVINLPVTNLDATQSQIYPGSLLTFSGQGFVSIGGNPVVTLNDVPIQATVTATQVTLQVPSTFSTGVFPLKVSNGVSSSYAVMVQIDNPPAVILSVTTPAGQSLLGSSVQQGDTLNVVVAGLDPTLMTSLGRLQVTIGGVPMQVIQLTPAANGQFTIQITVTQSFGGSQVPLAVLVDGASSLPIALTVK